MIRKIFECLLGFALVATTAAASDLTNLSDSERQALRNEIRAYLLENPEVLVEAIEVLNARSAQAEAESDVELVAANAEELFGDSHSWIGGNLEGDIVMVEFIDYRCGYCRRAYDDVETLIARDGNIRFIVKEYPVLGQESLNSARAAIAVLQTHGSEAYKEIHDELIAFNGTVDEAYVRRFADDNDMDADTIIAQLDSQAVNSAIAANRALAERLNINGTPAFVIGGLMVRGWIPLETMEEIVMVAREQ